MTVKLKDLYRIAVDKGMAEDQRDPEELDRVLGEAKKAYDKLDDDEDALVQLIRIRPDAVQDGLSLAHRRALRQRQSASVGEGGLDAVLHVRHGREHDDGGVAPLPVRPVVLERPGDLPARQLGHDVVQEHEVGGDGLDLRERFLAVAGLLDRETQLGEHHVEELEIGRFVIDDEDPPPGLHAFILPRFTAGVNLVHVVRPRARGAR